jgi:hypothetical protein
VKPKRQKWVVDVRYPRNDKVLTDSSGNVTGLVYGPWSTESGPFAAEAAAKLEGEVLHRIEKATGSGAEIRVRRDWKKEAQG